jgi:hypothetical protein
MPKNRKNGQSLVEAVCGLVIMIPIALLILDIVTVCLCLQTNDLIAKTACRAAGRCLPPSADYGAHVTGPGAPTGLPSNINAPTTVQQFPQAAAEQSLKDFKTTAIITNIKLVYFCENAPYYYSKFASIGGPSVTPALGQATVITEMTVQLPVPVFTCSRITLYATSTEPVTAVDYVAQALPQ